MAQQIESDMDSGRYIDPTASRIKFRQYAENWLFSQTAGITTRDSVDVQIRRHAIPYLGPRPLGPFKPEHIRDWLSELERAVPASP
ncbi:hypothetical protein ACFYZ9_12120 [Streptomyces sp. NPDC001691]|uniref:hypothetical protein n=1 Tax=unclassified Streptomyces TaxID=2593676 RepID=UPI001CB8E7A7|nr:hypothetical protein [Streptomyces sp. SDr-06]